MFITGATFAQMPHISSTQTQKLPDIPEWLATLMLTIAVLYIVARIKDYTESVCMPNSHDRHGSTSYPLDRLSDTGRAIPRPRPSIQKCAKSIAARPEA